MRKERNRKSNILIYVVAALLCATLFSMYLVGGLYARYQTKSSGSDTARVAAFNIKEEGISSQMIEARVVPGETQGTSVKITNKSEVTLELTLKVTNITKNIPQLKFQLKPTPTGEAAETPAETPKTEKHENGVSLYGVVLEPGDYTKTYDLYIVWEPNPTDPEADLAYMGMVDYISVTVTATQVD